MSILSPIQSITLRFKKGEPPTQEQVSHTQTIPLESIQSLTTPNKSIKIDSNFVAAFNNEQAGTIFTPSIVVNYENNVTITTSPASGVPNFVPRKITPTITLASIPDKLSTDPPFYLLDFITTPSPGVLSYSSSDTSVAEVNSLGQVTLKGVEGTTTISITQAASNDGRYNASSSAVSTTIVVLPLISLAENGVTIKYTPPVGYTPPPFPFFVQANLRGTGVERFAVVDNSAKSAITSYAITNGTSSSYFTPQGQSEPIPFNNIVTTNMTDMFAMFEVATTFNQPIGSWDTSNVTNMRYMFYATYVFNQSISLWNTSKVTNMEGMFSSARAFNHPIDSWNTSSVTNMNGMFYQAISFNQNIGSWNTSNVTNMAGMFVNTPFNQPINTNGQAWNTSKVTNMFEMFGDARLFNQNISSWNTSNVTNMINMFYGATAFNQNISGWNVTKVTPKPPTNFSTSSALTAQNSPSW
jgi:surface protein